MKSEESEMVFRSGFNCAQAVLVPFATQYGLGAGTGEKIASAFGAGMGRMQETCGAVTGAFMAFGLKYGFTKGDDQGQKDVVLAKVKEFSARFREEFGTLRCKELLGGCDLNTEEGRRIHKESGQRDSVCMKCVKFAASAVEEGS